MQIAAKMEPCHLLPYRVMTGVAEWGRCLTVLVAHQEWVADKLST